MLSLHTPMKILILLYLEFYFSLLSLLLMSHCFLSIIGSVVTGIDSMLSRAASMGFDEEENTAQGKVPDYGAIFMSNAATKKECFKLKLFGLPSVLGNFVRQVKTGMILFLFEFERRELHGVFQACSDGAMNIVPHAYRSSGKQFPAQVKFTPIWHCSPLLENEFRDAIRENYFSAYKFNFGLSERQVQRLLSLFGPRKIKNVPLQREFTLRKIPRSIGYSTNKFRSADDGSFVMVDDRGYGLNANGRFSSVMSAEYSGGFIDSSARGINEDSFASVTMGNELKVDSELEPDILSEKFGNFLDKVGRTVEDDRSITRDIVGNECNVENKSRLLALPDYAQSFALNRRVSDDVSFGTSYGLGNKHDVRNGFGPSKLTEYSGSFQSNSGLYSNKTMPESNSLISEQLQSVRGLVESNKSSDFYPSCSSAGMEMENVSYPTSYGDAIITNTLPYDPDISSLTPFNPNFPCPSYGCPSPLRLCNSVSGYSPSLKSIIPCIENQSCPSFFDPESTSRYNINSGLSNIPLSRSGQFMYSDITRVPLPGFADAENVTRKSSGYECTGHFSFRKPSSAPNFSQSGTSETTYDGLFHSSSPRKGETSYDGYFHSSSPRKGETAYDGSFRSSSPRKDPSFHLENHDIPMNPGMDLNSGFVFSDRRKDRVSVFDRIALPPKRCDSSRVIDAGIDGDNMNLCVDEIMDVLSQSHHQWSKAKSFKPLDKKFADVENLLNKTERTAKLNNCQAKVLKELKVNDVSSDNVIGLQRDEVIPFVNFKRRSKVQKTQDAKPLDHNENPKSDGSSGMQHKRRKLIRPKFSKIVSSDDTMDGSLDDENKISQNFPWPRTMFHVESKVNNLDSGRGSNCVREEDTTKYFDVKENVGSCIESLRNTDERKQEASQNVDIPNVPFSVSCKDESQNAEIGLIVERSEAGKLSQHHDYTGCSISQVPPPALHGEKSETGTYMWGTRS